MPEPVVRRRIADVLDAVRNRPHVLPARELAALQGSGVDVGIERTDGETVVVVEPRADDRLACLSPREREVVTLAAAGMSNQQIATTLFVSLATVKDHMHSVLKKTGLESRTQVVAAWYGGLPGNPGTTTTTTTNNNTITVTAAGDTSDEPAGSD